ncbi:hypothetical protein GCK72_003759 [Caenorhabditis remanei]|uniref:BTB domain-containing protein n=1 Tax=Caenorhabditis remanei TaxID=31234 RepID=A0A6A5HAF3_CAERE|nr:hypothetical protein GCK72_003759 [Caenorhabditis remanei]KAF1763814.1 hypothetical protein GCK72_003759 [Caenorhabditis remanei]
MVKRNNNDPSTSCPASKIQKTDKIIENNQVCERDDRRIQEIIDSQKRIETTIQEIAKQLSSADQIQMNNEDSESATATMIGCPKKSIKNETMLESGKSFILKHIFKDVPALETGKSLCSEWEDHFGALWRMQIRHQDTFLAIYLDFMRNENWENLTTELNFKVKIQPVGCPKDVYHAKATFEKNRKTVTNGYARLINWDEVERKYTENGRLPLEIQVKVNKTIDARKADLRSFGDERSEFSDVTLNVDGELFHVSKHILAYHSDFFRSMFVGNFKESTKSVIELKGIDPYDFENYLEALYGKTSVINDSTVEGILLIADMYGTQIIADTCTKFLEKESTKKSAKKLHMSCCYNLEGLKKTCLSQINTTSEIKAAIPKNAQILDRATMISLLEKLIDN